MTRSEHNVKTASDLYEARRAAKFLLGAKYAETLKPYRDIIGRVMAAERVTVLQAALRIGQRLPVVDAVPLMCVIAAAVEMCEEPETDDAVARGSRKG